MAQTLTSEETRKLLDDLFALPDKEKKTKPKAKEAKQQAPKPAGPVKIQCSPHWKPQHSIIEIVHQQCTTCGAEHQFLRNRLVRFEAKAKGTLHTFVEIETLTIDKLPREVDHSYQTTNVCPSCVVLASSMDDFFALSAMPQQLELFHG
jgi:hypothetical protein